MDGFVDFEESAIDSGSYSSPCTGSCSSTSWHVPGVFFQDSAAHPEQLAARRACLRAPKASNPASGKGSSSGKQRSVQTDVAAGNASTVSTKKKPQPTSKLPDCEWIVCITCQWLIVVDEFCLRRHSRKGVSQLLPGVQHQHHHARRHPGQRQQAQQDIAEGRHGHQATSRLGPGRRRVSLRISSSWRRRRAEQLSAAGAGRRAGCGVVFVRQAARAAGR
jgi:hypothetical protein